MPAARTPFADALEHALARCADPVHAAPRAADVLAAAADDDGFRALSADDPTALARVIATLCGGAPFLASYLIRHPHWVARLARDELSRERSATTYDERASTALVGVAQEAEGDALRLFKYYELARITVRELSADLVPAEHAGETLSELSHLADAVLTQALRCATARLAGREAARWRAADGGWVELRFCVLGLGKLGGEELNYSSDVDLVYVFENPPGGGAALATLHDGPRGMAPLEYFTRLAQELGRLVSETTANGFLYRIDLDLRPEGSQGPLVVSSDVLINYYELWSAAWEKAVVMKARPVGGDLAFGWRTIRALDPIIYRSATDYGGVAAIREIKARVEQAKASGGETFDVKIGAGGIRDVEFVAQALQLLHGGRMPQVRGRATQTALEALAEVGVLPRDDAAELLAAYRFLRRVENRIQMEGERQRHRLPRDGAGRERLARAMGFDGPGATAAFERALDEHRERVRRRFAALFPTGSAEPILDMFARAAPRLFQNPTMRPHIEDLAAQLARQIDAGPEPERALNNLERFIRGLGARRFYYELLIDRPELVPRLAALFGASEYLSSYFANYPRLIEPIFSDPTVLLLTRAQLQEELAAIRDEEAREQHDDETERRLAALRLFHHRALVNVGLLDLSDKVSLPEVERALTDIAEVCITEALSLARDEQAKRGAPPAAANAGEFLVVGMGKLATSELMYGSDLDVIFLYDVGDDDALAGEAQEYFVRVAQKLIWALQARTREGICYEIDARLRPSGNQGMLVTSLAGFRRYHAAHAHLWERQALLRARPVAGGARLSASFADLRVEILRHPLPPDAGREIHRLRVRMERELARETSSHHDFKAGRGGVLDVESIVQFLQLAHGDDHPELLQVAPTAVQLERLARLGLLSAADAGTLREGWTFLQRLSSRLRIVENRSISDLDEERGDLDALARRLGYRAPQRATGARRALLEDYRRHTSAIRDVYLRVLNTEKN